MRFVMAFALVIFLNGCSIATGKKFSGLETPHPDTARIYILRTEGGKSFNQQNAVGDFPDISVNNKIIGPLKRGGYLTANTSPGLTKIFTEKSINWQLGRAREEIFSLSTQAGHAYFIQLDFSRGFGYTYSNLPARKIFVNVREITEAEAVPLLRELVFSE